MDLNLSVFKFLHGLTGRSPALDRLTAWAADDLGWLLLLVWLAYVLYEWRRGRRGLSVRLLFILGSSLCAWVVAEAIQFFYFHPRPFAVLTGVNQLLFHPPDNSFPSGHAAFFFAWGASVSLFRRRLGGLYLVGALVIGLARVIAGVHWPFDVLAGWLLGGLTVGSLRLLFRLSP